MKITKILTLLLVLTMALSIGAFASGEPSAEGSGETMTVEEAYVEYIREWLANELLHNDQMTQEQIDNEYMPLIEAGDYTSFPVSYLYDGWLETGVAMTFEEFAAQYTPAGNASSEEPGGGMTVEEAYVEYIREWLANELLHNDQMTQEQIDNEYMPLIEAGDYTSFPVSYLYDGWLETGVAMTFEEFAAQYTPAGGEVTWADYQAWLVSILPEISPDPEGVSEIILATNSWDEIDMDNGPWGKIFGEDAFNCTNWDEFAANGGVGTYNADFIDLPA